MRHSANAAPPRCNCAIDQRHATSSRMLLPDPPSEASHFVSGEAWCAARRDAIIRLSARAASSNNV